MSHNPTGNNQYGTPKIKEHVGLADILQGYANERVPQDLVLLRLKKDHGIDMSLRSLQRARSTLGIRSPRNPKMTEQEMGVAIVQILEDDPNGRWGYRKVQEKLAHDGIHIPRQFIENFMRARDTAASNARNPKLKSARKHALASSGPNSEWGGDVHEKLLAEMGISVYGFVDKASRRELGLYAVARARVPDVPVAIYLFTARKQKGIPIQLLTSEGSESENLAAVHTALRSHYQPALTIEELPPHKSTKSVTSTVRERGFGTQVNAELENVLVAWRRGTQEAGLQPHNTIHNDLALWIWSHVVQNQLDSFVAQTNSHRIRKQKKTNLPSGGSRNDFYHFPERWGMKDMRIPVDNGEIDRLLAVHCPQNLFQFASDGGHALAEGLYRQLGEPPLTVLNGWQVFRSMLSLVR